MANLTELSSEKNKKGSGYCFLVARSNGFWPSMWKGFHVFDFYDTFLFYKKKHERDWIYIGQIIGIHAVSALLLKDKSHLLCGFKTSLCALELKLHLHYTR